MTDGFKEILVCADASENVDPALYTALAVARKFNSHINALHVRKDPSCILPVPIVTTDMAGFVVNDVIAAEESALSETADKTRRIFESFAVKENISLTGEVSEDSVTAEYRELCGRGEDIIAWSSRVADLTVMSRPDPASLDQDAFSLMNAALMESGSAVLIAPSTPPVCVGERIAIAWDASEEAATAVAYALPFLKTAKEVVLIETSAPNPELAGIAFVQKRLSRHGVDASILIMPENASVAAAGDELIRQTCGRFDLLVMGAYTQSNMRRWILGSTTKYMVERADIPLFMAH